MPQDEHDRRIDYIEFPVPDVSAAKKFYSSVFRWIFTDYGPDYTSFSDGRLAGGLAMDELLTRFMTEPLRTTPTVLEMIDQTLGREQGGWFRSEVGR